VEVTQPGVCHDDGVNARLASAAAALLAAAALSLAGAAAASAGTFSPGSKSLGDPIFPQIGNGGYDVGDYEVDIDYDPSANELLAGTKTTITATATQDLSRFSLDFQRDLAIDSVTVDGNAAAFTRADAKPKLSNDPDVTQPAKLTITPGEGIAKGTGFEVVVAYSGEPQEFTDTDGSLEGWVRACSAPGNCDGSFTVSEPIGAQSWFPCNDHPSDKATFTLHTTAPSAYTAIGAGHRAGIVDNGDGTSTTTWVEDTPMATYLSTGTVGRFDVEESTMTDRSNGAEIPVFTAVDSAGSGQQKAKVLDAADRIPEIVNFLARKFGSYPFETTGVVADWVPSVGYELENQTKPHFAGDKQGPAIDVPILAHEIAHQWMGDSISPARWSDIWFNEGWAQFSQVLFKNKVDGAKRTPRRFFRAVYAARGPAWRLQPAVLDHDPSKLFSGFAVYARPGAMLEGFREIVGNKTFYKFAKRLGAEHGGGTISRRQFVRDAKRASELNGRKLRRLGRYFHQWLLWEKRPKLTPSDF
jgi:aminopeptidase N